MPADVLPYLVPTAGTVELREWLIATAEAWEPLPAQVADWDTTTNLELRRSTALDPSRLLRECRLDPGDDLVWSVSWISTDTDMRGHSTPTPLHPSGTTALSLTLPGDRIGAAVTLRTSLVLRHTDRPAAAGVAHRPGSILTRHETRIALGTAAQRFPVHALDFAATRLDANSSWHLETTTDPTAPFLGTFLLLINTRDRELVAAVTQAQRNARQEALVDDLEHGVAALLLELALHLHSELHEGAGTWSPGSVGEMLESTLERARRSGAVDRPTGADTLARARTRILGATRSAGHGRLFT